MVVEPERAASFRQKRSLAAAMKIHWPSRHLKLRYGDSDGCPEPSARGSAPVSR